MGKGQEPSITEAGNIWVVIFQYSCLWWWFHKPMHKLKLTMLCNLHFSTKPASLAKMSPWSKFFTLSYQSFVFDIGDKLKVHLFVFSVTFKVKAWTWFLASVFPEDEKKKKNSSFFKAAMKNLCLSECVLNWQVIMLSLPISFYKISTLSQRGW